MQLVDWKLESWIHWHETDLKFTPCRPGLARCTGSLRRGGPPSHLYPAKCPVCSPLHTRNGTRLSRPWHLVWITIYNSEQSKPRGQEFFTILYFAIPQRISPLTFAKSWSIRKQYPYFQVTAITVFKH
jgi:hypothetical protein